MEALSSPEPRPERAIVFVGFMGSGKSLAARGVAADLGAEPLDADREIERELGESIESFFDREGEPAFRAREEETVMRLLERPDARVIALGGGAIESEHIREAMRRHVVCALEVDPAVAWQRASGKGRPLARDKARFEDLYRERTGLYESMADAILPPGGRDIARRALPALRCLASEEPGVRMIWATAESGDYPVFFARGLIERGFFFPGEGRRFVITDENVAAHHSLGSPWQVALPAGEEQKNLGRVGEVLSEMARAGVTREDLVAALGGGVVGDLGGFCAHIYQRGVACVQVPTTLVAQVDSAYGGKTGVDLPEGKNYAGAFHQPASVLVDPGVLQTLPDEEVAAGYAEVVKTALIAGGQLWARVRDGADPVSDEVILGCLRTKLGVVASDERDSGRRQVLNLGHTIGHAIEAATGYGRYRHGEAIAIGLLASLRLSGKDALHKEVGALLASRALPDTYDGAAPEEVMEFVQRDKKRAGAGVPFVLLASPGDVTPGHSLPDADVLAAIEEVHEG